jgi:hypothetical protein
MNASGFEKDIDRMSRPTAKPAPLGTPDWRAEAEAAGRAAYEALAVEAQDKSEPLAWLPGYLPQMRKETR